MRVSAMTLAALLPLAIGCTSNEYVIPHEELARLASAPPALRGARVRVVQKVGERRGEPVSPQASPAASDPSDQRDDEVGRGDLEVDLAPDGRPGRRQVRRPDGGFGAWSREGHPRARIWRPAAPSGGKAEAGGGVNLGNIGGGGGGGGGDDLAVLAVVVVVVAVVVAVGLVSTEGVRFDGYVALSPAQPIHLRAADGEVATIPIADLSPALVDETVEAEVMDDEGFGIQRLDRAPLDRRGGTFKLDSGTIAFGVAGTPVMGPTMNVQAGCFFTPWLGLLVNVGLGAGDVPQGLVPRHALSLELQAFPLARGRFHLGAFGDGGMAISQVLVGSTPTYVSGPSVGGGVLAELDLTTRLALTLRAGANLSELDQAWTPAGTLTGGVAVY